jgi:hypothetical protein
MYYGEGQRGDMEFSRGNKSVLEHKETGNRIRLFMGAKGEVTYESQFETDEEKPFELIEDLDIEGKERVAIVFRLRAVRPYKTHLPETNIRVTEKTTVEAVDVESFNTDGFEIEGTGRREGVRKESKLMSQYIKYRKDNEQPPLESRKIKVAGEAVNSSLRVDGWVEQDKLLIEAKSSCTRHQVRLAIGQLFDYKRYLDPKRMAILLPSKPKTDLIELIKSLGIELIYKTKGKEFKEIK